MIEKSIDTIQPPSNKYGVTTPLRYPGGKSVIAGLLSYVIDDLSTNRGKITTYVEPYAGGAGAAVSLLLNDQVDNIVINDFDKAVYSFWDSVRYRHSALIELIWNTPITMEEWYKQKKIYSAKETFCAKDRLALGFSFFFLNRTNRSGILEAGVVGGKAQSGKYTLDARYRKEALVPKIEKIAARRKSITVLNQDGLRVFNQYKTDQKAFIYLDPPYVQQGNNLYLNAFDKKCHSDLSEKVTSQINSNWLMTYDDDALIKDLYKKNNQYQYQLRYTAQKMRHENELMICSDPVNLSVKQLVKK